MTEPKKLVKIFNDVDYWAEGDKPNTWTWLDERGFKTPSELYKGNEIKPRDKNKDPLLVGSIMTNFTTGLFHKVLGEVMLEKDKLIIEVGSTQKAHIVQDFIEEHLEQMVGKSVMTKRDVNDPSVHYMDMLK